MRYWDGDESGVILERGFYLSGVLNEVKEQTTGQIQGENIPGKGKSTCKVPEARTCECG